MPTHSSLLKGGDRMWFHYGHAGRDLVSSVVAMVLWVHMIDSVPGFEYGGHWLEAKGRALQARAGCW